MLFRSRTHQEDELKELAEYIYNNIFLHYTMKQWGSKPEDIDPMVSGRVPVLVSYDNRYFQDAYQGMPKDGYTTMIERILQHENITIQLHTKGQEVISLLEGHNSVYYLGKPFTGDLIITGAVDSLLDYKYGELPYRTLDFVWEHYNKEYQPFAVVNYTVSEDYTRITEFKH